ncbi:MAG TPA: DUF3574 domain-containing protein [Thermoanaerobaculia bacterium]|nr:DUF3574 domain-containing protein [Thermoanaerobaculia bacterium]
MTRAAISLALLLTVSCAAFHEVQEIDTLYFGMNEPAGGVVTDDEWAAFVAEVITPRFDGFTEWRAEGRWKGEKEGTRIVQIVHPPRPSHDRAIHEIIAAYKQRFRQEAVLLVRTRGLAVF